MFFLSHPNQKLFFISRQKSLFWITPQTTVLISLQKTDLFFPGQRLIMFYRQRLVFTSTQKKRLDFSVYNTAVYSSPDKDHFSFISKYQPFFFLVGRLYFLFPSGNSCEFILLRFQLFFFSRYEADKVCVLIVFRQRFCFTSCQTSAVSM